MIQRWLPDEPESGPLRIGDWVEPAGEGTICEVLEFNGNWKLCRPLDERWGEWRKHVTLNRRRPPLLDCRLTHMPWRKP